MCQTNNSGASCDYFAFAGSNLKPCWIPQVNNMLDQHVLGSLEACNTWKNYTCMYNATTYFKFFIANECIKSCETVNYNVVERVQHLVPSIWVRSACMNIAPQISPASLLPSEWEDEKSISESILWQRHHSPIRRGQDLRFLHNPRRRRRITRTVSRILVLSMWTGTYSLLR